MKKNIFIIFILMLLCSCADKLVLSQEDPKFKIYEVAVQSDGYIALYNTQGEKVLKKNIRLKINSTFNIVDAGNEELTTRLHFPMTAIGFGVTSNGDVYVVNQDLQVFVIGSLECYRFEKCPMSSVGEAKN